MLAGSEEAFQIRGEGAIENEMSAIDSLLAGLIDYAGLYPPAGLDMRVAARNYLNYRQGRHAPVLGRFIVDLSRLVELRQIAGHSIREMRLTVVAPTTADWNSLLPLIEATARDKRNFVRKSVNWALRQIGKRNLALNAAAVVVARRLAVASDASSRWVGKDALRELTGDSVLKRLRARAATPRTHASRRLVGTRMKARWGDPATPQALQRKTLVSSRSSRRRKE